MSHYQQNNKIAVIDALRGLSLAGVVLVHVIEQFIGAVPPTGAMDAVSSSGLDTAIFGIVNFFFATQVHALFAFIFGLSFYLQMQNEQRRGALSYSHHFRRLFVLLLFGLATHLFYRGDILSVFAVVGVLLPLFYSLTNRWIIITAALLIAGVGRYLMFGVFQAENIFLGYPMKPSSTQILDYFNTIKSGPFYDVVTSNITDGMAMKAEIQINFFGRAYQIFAMFLLGIIAGRYNVFTQYIAHKKVLKRTFWVLLALTFIGIPVKGVILHSVMESGSDPQFDNWTMMIVMSFFDVHNYIMCGFYITALLLAFNTKKGKRIVSPFIPYGQTSLTHYIGHIVLGTFLMYGWGLELLAEFQHSHTFLLAVFIIVIQVYFSRWWLARCYYGPLEWVWRSATQMKAMPLLRSPANGDGVVGSAS